MTPSPDAAPHTPKPLRLPEDSSRPPRTSCWPDDFQAALGHHRRVQTALSSLLQRASPHPPSHLRLEVRSARSAALAMGDSEPMTDSLRVVGDLTQHARARQLAGPEAHVEAESKGRPEQRLPLTHRMKAR